jgi:chromosomal replication initiation ATPase DnaA
MQNVKVLWQQVLEKLELRISSVSYTLWIKPIKPIEIDEKDNFVIAVQSLSAKNQILRNFIDKIVECCNEISNKNLSLTVLDPNEEIEYLKNKGLKNKTYEILILEWLRKCDGLTAKKIFEMIEINFSTQLNKEQKKKKLDNLLQNMRKHNKIIVEHDNRNSIWKLK